MIEFVVISLFVLLLLSYYTMGRNLSRPSVLYIGGFLVCSVVAFFYKEEWGLHKMAFSTSFVLVGGALVFYLVEYKDYKSHPSRPPIVDIGYEPFYTISSTRLTIFLCFQLLSMYLMAQQVKSYAMTSDLSAALLEVNDDKKFNGLSVPIPSYVQNLYKICFVAQAYWCALLPYYMFKSNKYIFQKILLALNLLVGMAGTLLGGGRTYILYDLISVFSISYMCFQFKHNWNGGLLPKKTMILIVSIIVLFIVSFMSLGYAVGKKESKNPAELVLTMYCGAEIKNLDDYIQKPFRQGNETGRFAQYTMCGMYDAIDNRLGKNVGVSRANYPDLKFNDYGGYPLGNVYTTYFNFIIDFGIVGAIIVTAIMSWITSIFYRKSLFSYFFRTGKMNLWLAYYVYIIPASCFLSFFSNKFFEEITISGTIKILIYWVLLSVFLYYKIPSKKSCGLKCS